MPDFIPHVGGEANIGADLIGGIHYQRVKIILGADGVNDGDLSAGNALPTSITSLPALATGSNVIGAVTQSGSWTISGSVAVTGTFWQATQPVSAAALPLPSGASTSAAQTTGNTALSSIDGKITACNTGAVVLSAGTENIGDVDVLSIAAGTNRLGAVYQVSGQLVDEAGTVRAVNRSIISATGLGNTAVVAAQGPGIRIRVLSCNFVALLAVTVKFQSATTDITGSYSAGATGGLVMQDNAHGWFQTNANEALNINLGIATTVGGVLTWIQAT